jgi:hypothetical protein
MSAVQKQSGMAAFEIKKGVRQVTTLGALALGRKAGRLSDGGITVGRTVPTRNFQARQREWVRCPVSTALYDNSYVTVRTKRRCA